MSAVGTPAADRVAVKICGLRDHAALEAAVGHGARWVGLVFFPRSPRHVGPELAAALSVAARGRAERVGLFVRPDERAVAEVLERVELDVLQVYDAAERVDALRRRFGRPVWLAHGVAAAGDLPDRCGADGLVIESRPPAGADRPGGNGARFDWALTAGWRAPVPWLLAGGLTPENVGDAVCQSGARAVDVSSGVETFPGHKDPAAIARFLAAAAGCSAAAAVRAQ